MEALTADASIPGNSSSVTLNSDLKLTGIHYKRLNEPIISKKTLDNEPKIAKKIVTGRIRFPKGQGRHPNLHRTQNGSRF
jgi:hypothetical protein